MKKPQDKRRDKGCAIPLKLQPEKYICQNHVGMPAALYLEEFGSQVWSAFGTLPYLVGSATFFKEWRDVDVRLILDDAEYACLGLGDPVRACTNAKWAALCMAFSALGTKMTGLPIDFQIQQRTYANAQYNRPRLALGLVGLRLETKECE